MNRIATAAYRGMFSLACCAIVVCLFDLWLNLPDGLMPEYRVQLWLHVMWVAIALVGLSGLRWTVRGAQGYGKNQP